MYFFILISTITCTLSNLQSRILLNSFYQILEKSKFKENIPPRENRLFRVIKHEKNSLVIYLQRKNHNVYFYLMITNIQENTTLCFQADCLINYYSVFLASTLENYKVEAHVQNHNLESCKNILRNIVRSI